MPFVLNRFRNFNLPVCRLRLFPAGDDGLFDLAETFWCC